MEAKEKQSVTSSEYDIESEYDIDPDLASTYKWMLKRNSLDQCHIWKSLATLAAFHMQLSTCITQIQVCGHCG